MLLFVPYYDLSIYLYVPCLTFFLSLDGSLSALIIIEAADGTTEIVA
jgi:hypothetical protein